MKNNPTIVYTGGFWSTNIGNAFFDLGCLHLLKKAMPDASIHFSTEQVGNYLVENGGNLSSCIDYIGNIEADYIVVAGPMLLRSMRSLWANTIDKMKKRGTKLVLLSAGCGEYNEDEKKIVRNFLEEVRPYAIISRDTYTYEEFGDLAENKYDGICCAFYVDDYFKPYKLLFDEYVVFNFDKGVEPFFNEELCKDDCGKIFEPSAWLYKKLSRYDPRRYMFAKKRLEKIGKYDVIRTAHSFNMSWPRKLLMKSPNMFVSDTPYDYLNLYANSKALLSDRVHACVAALAFGKPAMFFGNTPRSKLFSRVGVEDINKRPVMLNEDFMKREKMNMLNYVKDIIK